MRDAGGGERAGERRADGGVDVAVLVAVDARRRAADVFLEPRELRARLGRRLRRHHRARVARLAEAEFSAEAGWAR